MLEPRETRALLIHDDADIRELALSYFFAYQEREPGLLADLLALIDAYPDCETARLAALRCSGAVSQDEELDAVLSFLDQKRPELIASLVQKAVVMAPPALLASRLEELRQDERLSKDSREAIAERAALCEQSTEELCAALTEAIELSAGDDISELDASELSIERLEEMDFGDPAGQSDRIDNIIDALEGRELPADLPLKERIGPSYHFWKRRSYIRLIGACRLRGLAPRLIADLGSEDSEDDEPRIEALANFADPELVPLIEESYRAKGLHARCSLCQVLATWKLPEAEAALIRMLEEETDPSQRTFLCLALTDLLSEAGYEPVLEVARGDYDRSVVHLGKRLRSLAAIFGKAAPEIDDDEDRPPAVFDRGSPLMLDIDPVISPASEPIETFRRADRKVGRNEPCPCGSGKKYKKCCGR